MDADITLMRLKLRDDFQLYANEFLKIRSKSSTQGVIPFRLNRVQKYLHDLVEKQKRETGKVRVVICKGRQQGCSTYIAARYFWLTCHNMGKRVFILTHDHDATNNLFEFANRYYENLPSSLRPHKAISNSKEIYFDLLDSGYKVGTAGNKGVGRSSTIQYLHGSEVAFWPSAEEHAKGILQAVPNEPGTEIFLESTARGVSNYYHDMWNIAHDKSSEWMPIFLPWYWQEEYIATPAPDFSLTEEEKELQVLYNISNEHLQWR